MAAWLNLFYGPWLINSWRRNWLWQCGWYRWSVEWNITIVNSCFQTWIQFLPLPRHLGLGWPREWCVLDGRNCWHPYRDFAGNFSMCTHGIRWIACTVPAAVWPGHRMGRNGDRIAPVHYQMRSKVAGCGCLWWNRPWPARIEWDQ